MKMNKLKEFYGAVSLAARLSFAVKAEDEEKAENIVFEDIEGIEIVLKNGTKLEITSIDWDLISEAERGNVNPPHMNDFDIQEEKE
jgi:hypothetical protein